MLLKSIFLTIFTGTLTLFFTPKQKYTKSVCFTVFSLTLILSTFLLKFFDFNFYYFQHILEVPNFGLDFLNINIILRLDESLYPFFTLTLALFFLFIQGIEFKEAPFSFSDGIYASTFFMATGFHGFHVLIGFVFLCVCWFRLYFNHFTNTHHVGFEAAAWYWHFVDIVWLFLFITVYWWGS